MVGAIGENVTRAGSQSWPIGVGFIFVFCRRLGAGNTATSSLVVHRHVLLLNKHSSSSFPLVSMVSIHHVADLTSLPLHPIDENVLAFFPPLKFDIVENPPPS